MSWDHNLTDKEILKLFNVPVGTTTMYKGIPITKLQSYDPFKRDFPCVFCCFSDICTGHRTLSSSNGYVQPCDIPGPDYTDFSGVHFERVDDQLGE